jgi:hypothetical protein
MKDRANALAARTTAVHGSLDIETHDKIIGTSEYETALVRLGRSRGLKSPFVPGHCFFSSVVSSWPSSSPYSHLEGARHARLLIASVYRDREYRGLFRTWFYADAGTHWPGHEMDKLAAPGVALSVTNDS